MAGFYQIESPADDKLEICALLADHTQDIAVGDVVSLQATGLSAEGYRIVADTVSGTGNPVFGVVSSMYWETAAESNKNYVAALTAGLVMVKTEGVFQTVSNAAVTLADFGLNFSLSNVAPTNGRSNMGVIGASGVATTEQFRLVGCEAANKLAAGDKLYVRINESQVKQEAGV